MSRSFFCLLLTFNFLLFTFAIMPVSKTDWLISAPVYPTNAKAGTPIFSFLNRLIRAENLTSAEAGAFYRALTAESPDGPQLSGAVVALTAKGVTSDELAGMASVMRRGVIGVEGVDKTAVDIAGTGSPRFATFNVATAAALVAAGAGLPIAKQCKGAPRGMDVLKELGVKTAGEPDTAKMSFSGTGMCFLDTPKFHPQLELINKIVSRLGLMTCFDFLPLLANPASVSRHFLGVWHRSLVEPIAEALSQLKSQRAWVVHASDGLDAITLNGETFVGMVEKGRVNSRVVSPEDFGLKAGAIDHLQTDTAKEGAAIIRDVLASRRRDEARHLVVLNAAAALVVGGIAKDPMHGARLAEQSIDSGQAQNKLDRLIQVTNKS